jgi:hypothetical protein
MYHVAHENFNEKHSYRLFNADTRWSVGSVMFGVFRTLETSTAKFGVTILSSPTDGYQSFGKIYFLYLQRIWKYFHPNRW